MWVHILYVLYIRKYDDMIPQAGFFHCCCRTAAKPSWKTGKEASQLSECGDVIFKVGHGDLIGSTTKPEHSLSVYTHPRGPRTAVAPIIFLMWASVELELIITLSQDTKAPFF